MHGKIFAQSSTLTSAALLIYFAVFYFGSALAADRLVGVHSAQVLSQSMPWIAQEAGLFKKYDLDFRLVFITSSPVATAATLGATPRSRSPAPSATCAPTFKG